MRTTFSSPFTLPGSTRRHWLAALAAGALLAPLPSPAQQPRVRLRMLLNTGFSSPQAWLWLAQARGYLAEEGVALDLTPGGGVTLSFENTLQAEPGRVQLLETALNWRQLQWRADGGAGQDGMQFHGAAPDFGRFTQWVGAP